MRLLTALLCVFLCVAEVAAQPIDATPSAPKEQNKTSLLEAAFNTANTFESVASRIQRLSMPRDPNWTQQELLNHRDELTEGLATEYWQEFSYAASLDHARTIKQEIIKETGDYELRRHAGECGLAATLAVTLIDLPLLWTLFVALRVRSSIKAVLACIVGTMIIRLIAWPFALSRPIPEDMLTAIWAQATMGLCLHRFLAFVKSRPLFEAPVAFNLPHRLMGVRPFLWGWAVRTIGLVNRWARRLDKCTLSLLALLPLAVFSFHFFNAFFALYAVVWGIYLFGFVLPLLVLEWIARFAFSAFKADLHGKMARSGTAALAEFECSLHEEGIPKNIKHWVSSGFTVEDK